MQPVAAVQSLRAATVEAVDVPGMQSAGAAALAAVPASATSAEHATEPSSLQALRDVRAQAFDPVRFHYLEALSRRVPRQHPAVRPILERRLQQAIADYAARFAERARCTPEPPAAARRPAGTPGAGGSAFPTAPAERAAQSPAGGTAPGVVRAPRIAQPTARAHTALGLLNLYLRQRTEDAPAASSGGPAPETDSVHEIRSARRFRQTWARMAAEDQVRNAAQRRPEGAGPLNSQVLVLRSLEWMRELSPDYLQRFLEVADTLLWLEQAEPTKAASRPGAGKAAGTAAKTSPRRGARAGGGSR
ncbi:DUF2894 domain-containing protein [Ramlibacter sp. AN1015]|uniref:DUF2894 domain-containing protein n=1 Tax=Ramlibacter sp. AN1015 TaxID=3133428 RepID=UPI0030BA39AE